MASHGPPAKPWLPTRGPWPTGWVLDTKNLANTVFSLRFFASEQHRTGKPDPSELLEI